MTEDEKQKMAEILRIAKGYLAGEKKKAVENCDFDTSLGIASNEARVEAHFRKRGVEVDGPAP